MKVLVVDDMEMNRNLLKTFLTTLKFEVDTANDGLEGLKKLESNKYDVIFTDIEMPNMNGLEFLSRIKRNPSYSFIPVIILSTLNDEATINKAKSLGAASYMVKPFNIQKMEKALAEAGIKR